MQLGIAEILKKVESEKDKKTKIEILRKNDSKVLQDIIRLAFDKVIKWALPEGAPPYKENEFPGNQPNLYSSWKRMYLFFPTPETADMKQVKREILFIQFLEQLDPEDAKLICAIKDKKMPYKIPKALFEEAFPGIFDTFKKREAAEVSSNG